jgi:hypothetical protein
MSLLNLPRSHCISVTTPCSCRKSRSLISTDRRKISTTFSDRNLTTGKHTRNNTQTSLFQTSPITSFNRLRIFVHFSLNEMRTKLSQLGRVTTAMRATVTTRFYCIHISNHQVSRRHRTRAVQLVTT